MSSNAPILNRNWVLCSPFIAQRLVSIEEDRGIGESRYNGTILQRHYWKMTIFL